MNACLLVLTATLVLQAAEMPPPGWRDAMNKALDLTLAGKDLEVVAMYETWVEEYPNFGEARMMLGAAHESVAREARTGRYPRELRNKHYELAILHMRTAIEKAGSRAPFDWMRSFIDIHGLIGVDRPVEYERLVRAAVKQYPAEPHAHAYLMALLAERSQPLEAAAAAARAAIPKTADAYDSVAASLAFHARDFGPLMSASALSALLAEASRFVDDALKLNPKHRGAVRTKTQIEQLRK